MSVHIYMAFMCQRPVTFVLILQEADLNLTAEFGYARDVYSFGVFVDSLLEQLEDLGTYIITTFTCKYRFCNCIQWIRIISQLEFVEFKNFRF